MFRIGPCLAAVLLVSATLHMASAQTASPATPAPTSTTAKPTKIKLTMEKLKTMKAQWKANKPKRKACRREVKAKGLTGDDRWFYIADCMEKT